MTPIKIAIVDDHPLAVNGIRMMLAEQKDMEVRNAYHSGKDLLEGLAAEQPDILLLDVLLPDFSGHELAAIIVKQYPEIRMVALTSLDAPAMVKSMLYNGCIGYLLKGTDQQTLITAIHHAYNKEEFIEPSLKEHLLQNMFKPQKAGLNIPYELTKREQEILQLIVQGNTTQEIADKLSISPRTAETHRLTLLKKMYAKNTAELVGIAVRLGLAE
ncbi:response regulator transcription factor [Taibaiella lutea]|uniref:Response regulator transcription factor n=1 Tax=Taibaiella lutea TaxID=2608001 RepID=A0A5M6CLP1_9BACT|nr:response regulator transcription factor [Taibaiella lutea]KAA5536131.1 response regulator transcription factor [Taibaiella lutea]